MKKNEKGITSKRIVIDSIKKHKLDILWKIITSVSIRVVLLISPILYSKAIDAISESKYNLAANFLILTFFVTGLHYIFNYINQSAYYNLYNKLYRYLGWNIIKNTQSNSAYSLSRFSLGEYSNMLNSDMNIIVDFLDSSIIRIVRVLEFLFIYYYFFTLNKVVFGVTVSVSILAILIEYLRGSKVEKYNLERKQAFDGYLSTVNDVFLGMNEIKGLHIIDRVKTKFEDSSNNYLEQNKKYNLFYQGGKFLIVGMISCIRYFLLIYGIYLIARGEFQIGMIILIYNYYTKMVENFDEICIMSVEFRNYKVSLKRLNKIFEYSNQIDNYEVNELNDVIGKIEFKDVIYGDKKDPILNKVSFKIKPNTITVITGKIGSGKTGIFDLIMRINKQHEGSITLNGIDIQQINENLYFDYVSLARKTPTFFDMTIMENLRLIYDNENKIKDVCKLMNIDSDIKKLSEGYNTPINSKEVNAELKTMLAIARVLIKDTTIMLFDEIIDTLDDNNKEQILKILKDYQSDHTILIISRSQDMLNFGSTLITMDRNTIKSIKNVD